ncbi:MAG: MBOAT family protein [Butyrivibrio sp.]|nr:MBOAT family protein [Butyrivibrio sp.]
MLFNSFIFILIFLPLAIALYFILNKYNPKLAQAYLLGMSLWFYGYQTPEYLIIIIASIIVNYLLTYIMRRSSDKKIRLSLLILGLILNVANIGYYKYLNFIKWNINTLFGTDFAINSIVLPLGISFYTIQQISFLVDSYKNSNLKYNFLEYALFVTYFPQLVAGPICYHSEIIPQFEDDNKKRINSSNLFIGLTWFITGLAKKVFIADILGNGVNYAFDNLELLGSLDIWITSLAYTFQIYFDFSGYSDMACGIAKMFNFDLPQNFNSPYKALSIRDFWKRWHMTLTRFLTTYIYFPLGGNRVGAFKAVINTLIVFLVSGIWHGANFTFILWGLLHGILLLVGRYTKTITSKIPKIFRWFGTFMIVNVLWLLFRASGISDWIFMVKKMFHFDKAELSHELLSNFDSAVSPLLVIALSILICIALPNNYVRTRKHNTFSAVIYAALLVLCIMTLNRVSIFLYFNF